MPYPASMQASIARLEESRQRRSQQTIPRLSRDEKLDLLRRYHPDFISETKRELRVGPNRGEPVPCELADVLEAPSLVDSHAIDLTKIDFSVDVLVIGGGGAGSAAALSAHASGAKVLVATKLRHGDSNTIMAEGGMAAVGGDNDSPALHYLDTIGGGHYENAPELIKALVLDSPGVIEWLIGLGVNFDRARDGTLRAGLSGGHCRPRIRACKDYTGLEIMRVIRDEMRSLNIEVFEFSPAIELILDETGQCAGAILLNLETNRYLVVQAKTVIIATGGIGRLHIQGFVTTNHYGATADGLVIACRAGAKLLHADSVQYHPTGTAWPEQMFGWLVTEVFRGYGAQLANTAGNRFVNELESRDTVSSAIIRECNERNLGIETPTGGVGMWLDTPLVDSLHGQGTVERIFAGCYRRFRKHDIDLSREPVLVFLTQHYHNGGLYSDAWGRTNVTNLYVAGETAGGTHGRNRLGGNSLIDIFVFGKRAGNDAAVRSEEVKLGKLTLQHVVDHNRELGEPEDRSLRPAPMLLPDYVGSPGKKG